MSREILETGGTKDEAEEMGGGGEISDCHGGS